MKGKFFAAGVMLAASVAQAQEKSQDLYWYGDYYETVTFFQGESGLETTIFDVVDEDSMKVVSLEGQLPVREHQLSAETSALADKARQMSAADAVKAVCTIEQATAYCTKLEYLAGVETDALLHSSPEHLAPFGLTHALGLDDCDGGMISAAVLLEDDGFHPYGLYVTFWSDAENFYNEHVVFVYKTDGGNYGTIGINEGDNVPPVHDSIAGLVADISDGIGTEYGGDFELNTYAVFDLASNPKVWNALKDCSLDYESQAEQVRKSALERFEKQLYRKQ